MAVYEVQGHKHQFFLQFCRKKGLSLACSLGWITLSSKESLQTERGHTSAHNQCESTLPPKRAPWESLVLALPEAESWPLLASQRRYEHLPGKPVDCQSLLSKQEPGLRVINHAPSDRNPGPYLYPKKCRWSLVPSSIKETDSPNKEAPYQISVREPEAAQGLCGKGFYEGRTQ